MREAVILEAVRTPYGRRGGAYREVRPDALLAFALNGLMARAGLDASKVEDVITGAVTQTGEQGANVGRLAVLMAGFPAEVPALSLNRMCGSGQQAVHFASQGVDAGDLGYAIGCGVESMTRVPMFSDIGGGFERLNPELLARVDLIHQGESAERIADAWDLTREMLDAFAAESHRRAEGSRHLHAELLPAPGMDAGGQAITLQHDEGVRGAVDPARMATLKTPFRDAGVVTAGNASQISDGAAAVLVGDRDIAVADGLRPRARFVARVVVGDDPTMQLTGVIPATRKALARAGMTLGDIDWIEINEAFASVALAWTHELGADAARVNPWGGAIAHGHPLGASGAGLMAKMLSGLEATGGTFGLQTMCIGHGMATATIIERL
ncbi:acetyl-CoA acetyltransferase [Deinococcus aerolatus]|uniref:Acetyl-CoA acetyltransferase n=1 Tax=Deinococcus aerolatus TaxID=522487 RepID=A0ABQ2GCI9_9DEIO|nr:thiolase family protein [Deinococcus aerolatus]GGL86853.1 acetyl-CoA acetyltransferase [Deinococcus aerolatus]